MIRSFIVVIYIFVSSFTSYSQTKDSLLRIASNGKLSDSIRYRAFYDLAWEYIYSNTDSSLLMAKNALDLTKKNGNKLLQSKLMNLFGSISQVNGKYIEAVDYYQKALQLGEDLKNDQLMLVAYGNIGALYVNLGQYQRAKEFALKSLRIAEKTNDKNGLASIYNNLSLIYCSEENVPKAVEYGRKALEIYMMQQDKNGMCSTTGNIGNAYFVEKNYSKALEYYNLCNKLAKEVDNPTEEATALKDIAHVYTKMKDYKKAIQYTEEALKIAEQLESTLQIQGCYFLLYECYKAMGQVEKALMYYEEYMKMEAKKNKDADQSEVSKRMLEFEFNKKAVADSIKNAEENKFKDAILSANRKQIEKDKQLQIALTVGLVFFILFGVIIFNRFRITNKQKQIIEIKNKQTEEQKLIIEEKQKEILDSITYAKRIQDSLLDDFEPVRKHFSDAFLLTLPKDIVSGDFYWLAAKNFNSPAHVRELFYVAVCDSTGHGVPGGFMSLLNMAYLNEAVNERGIYEPGKIFDYARDRLINTISKSEQSDGFDGILLCFETNSYFNESKLIKTEKRFSYSGAYNAPLVVREGAVVESKTDKMPVGFSERLNPFNTFEFELQANDMIYIFSDGYADQFGGPKEKKFQFRQLQEMLLQLSGKNAEDQRSEILNRFVSWKGNQMQMDDVCMIGIRI